MRKRVRETPKEVPREAIMEFELNCTLEMSATVYE